MSMKWFGTSWGSRLCQEAMRVEAPVGRGCLYCEEEILEGESGVLIEAMSISLRTEQILDMDTYPLHIECFSRSITKSVGHMKGTCACYGGTEEDPPGSTLREGAKAAWDYAAGVRDGERVRDALNVAQNRHIHRHGWKPEYN